MTDPNETIAVALSNLKHLRCQAAANYKGDVNYLKAAGELCDSTSENVADYHHLTAKQVAVMQRNRMLAEIYRAQWMCYTNAIDLLEE